MNKFLLLISLVSLSSFAAYKPGTQCGLSEVENEGWKEVSSIDLGKHSKFNLNRLSTETKQQLIIAAKQSVHEFENADEITNTKDAVEYLREGSEDGDLYVEDFLFHGRAYTQVKSYPGGNPVGFIYKEGSLRIIAKNNDGSIECK